MSAPWKPDHVGAALVCVIKAIEAIAAGDYDLAVSLLMAAEDELRIARGAALRARA